MNDWLEFMNGNKPMTWELWQANMQHFNSLSSKGKKSIPKIIESISNFLGPDYLKRCLITEPDHPLFSIEYPMFNDVPLAIINLFDLYVKLELASKQKGWSRFRRAFTPNCSSESWIHGMIQLELAGFAARYGYESEFEPRLVTGKKGDFNIRTKSGNQFFEAVTIGTSDTFRKAEFFYNQMSSFLYYISKKHSLEIKGELKACPKDDQKKEDSLSQISSIINLMNFPRNGDVRLLENEFVHLEIIRSDEYKMPDLKGAITTTDSWHRLERCIFDKGRQSLGARNVWLRIDEGSGMWAFTTWANQSLEKKMTLLLPSIRQALRSFEHVSGIIISSGASISTDQRDNQKIVKNGNIAIRSIFPSNKYRETIIITQDKNANKDAREIAQWYQEEPYWLDWAADHLEIPLMNEVLASLNNLQ